MKTITLVASAALAAALAAGSAGAETNHWTGMSVDTLKAIYLDCDARSREAVLPMADVMACSVSAEALLERGFERDFGALLAWWRDATQPQATAAVAAEGLPPMP